MGIPQFYREESPVLESTTYRSPAPRALTNETSCSEGKSRNNSFIAHKQIYSLHMKLISMGTFA